MKSPAVMPGFFVARYYKGKQRGCRRVSYRGHGHANVP